VRLRDVSILKARDSANRKAGLGSQLLLSQSFSYPNTTNPLPRKLRHAYIIHVFYMREPTVVFFVEAHSPSILPRWFEGAGDGARTTTLWSSRFETRATISPIDPTHLR
jgi:hypothetical protein